MGGSPPYGASPAIGSASAPASAAASKAPTPARATGSPAGVGAAVQETEEEVLAAVFGKKLTRIEVTTTAEGAEKLRALQEVGGLQVVSVEPANPDAEYKQSILDRAAAEGRELRQDEKAKVNGPPLLLAQKFEDAEDLDPTGWHYSEKLDGVRGYWNGKDLISRQGNKFYAPDWFKAGLPDHPLDGELWMARKSFQPTLSIVRSQDSGERWKQIMYLVFDMPKHGGKFEERLAALEALAKQASPPYMKVHSHDRVQSRQHVLDELKKYVALGAEGLMLRKPGSLYEPRRSSTLLKMKLFSDAEAEVIAHEGGKGKHKGKLGALVVKMPSGKTFNVGTGLSDEERRNPPKIGSIITYSFTELTDDGIPKCAAFVAVRDYE